jgi:predicted nucleotidyltransferase
MVSPADAAKTIRAKNEVERKAITKRREEAWAEGIRLAKKILIEHPEALRVWGFGSTYETWRNYRLNSDIDLAAEGGSALELLKIVEESSFKVDVVSFEEIPPSLADFIRKQGVLLAEATDVT